MKLEFYQSKSFYQQSRELGHNGLSEITRSEDQVAEKCCTIFIQDSGSTFLRNNKKLLVDDLITVVTIINVDGSPLYLCGTF